jgi:hypothetical protein
MTAALPLIVVAALLVFVFWVFSDASTHARNGTPVTSSIGSLTLDTPAAWAAACLVLSVIFIPLYVSARRSK